MTWTIPNAPGNNITMYMYLYLSPPYFIEAKSLIQTVKKVAIDTPNMFSGLKYRQHYVKAIFKGRYEEVNPGLLIKPYLHQYI